MPMHDWEHDRSPDVSQLDILDWTPTVSRRELRGSKRDLVQGLTILTAGLAFVAAFWIAVGYGIYEGIVSL